MDEIEPEFREKFNKTRCPICESVEGCDHTMHERLRALEDIAFRDKLRAEDPLWQDAARTQIRWAPMTNSPIHGDVVARLRKGCLHATWDDPDGGKIYTGQVDVAVANGTMSEAADLIEALQRELAERDAVIADLRGQVRSCRCPVPVLDDETIGACVDTGKCGCLHRAAAIRDIKGAD